MAKGEIILISFPFTDLTGNKLRPAVVLTENNFDVTVCFITTQLGWQENTDVILIPDINNGLKKLSLIRTSKIATINKTLGKGVLGQISKIQTEELNNKLMTLLKLKNN